MAASGDAVILWSRTAEPAGAGDLPTHDELMSDLRVLRERGLLRLRELDLPALRAACGGGDARAVENLLREGAARLGDEELGTAAHYLFGLVQGTAGRRPTDLRERAAQEFGVSPETFRKDREKRVVSRFAEEILQAAEKRRAVESAPSAPSAPVPQHRRATSAPGAVGSHTERAPLSAVPLLPVQARPLVTTSGLRATSAFFTARGDELRTVVGALRRSSPGRAAVCVVHGMPGVGKTELALRAAHALEDDFPGGRLFLPLHGGTPGAVTVTAADATVRILRRLGVDGPVPEHDDDREALLLERLSGGRVLLVLDDARDVAQVEPLLRAAPGCGVLVTSRDRLTGLQDVTHLALDVLAAADGEALFAAVAGPGHTAAADADLVRDIAGLCGHLPLALRIAAARHRSVPADGLAALRDRLRDARTRLGELDDGAHGVAAVLTDSVAALPADARAAFTLLGAHPGPDVEEHAACALLDRTPDEARRLLRVLVDRHLVAHDRPGRYRCHDLVAALARERAAAAPGGTAAALRRVVDHHHVAALRADEVLTPGRHRPAPQVVAPPAHLPPLADYHAAVRWMEDECDNLVAVCVAAGRHGLDVPCWQLAHTLRGWFFIGKRWPEWDAAFGAALAATRRCGDRRAEAQVLNNLGVAQLERGRSTAARELYDAAGVIFRDLADGQGEHTTVANQAWVDFAEDRFAEFLDGMRRAYDWYVAHGADRNAAITLRGMALGEIRVGRADAAVRSLEVSLARFEELGLRFDAVIALNNLGEAYRAAGDRAAATAAHARARDAAEVCRSAFETARADRHLGDLAHDAGDLAEARRRWTDALAVYERLGSPELDDVRARLSAAS